MKAILAFLLQHSGAVLGLCRTVHGSNQQLQSVSAPGPVRRWTRLEQILDSLEHSYRLSETLLDRARLLP